MHVEYGNIIIIIIYIYICMEGVLSEGVLSEGVLSGGGFVRAPWSTVTLSLTSPPSKQGTIFEPVGTYNTGS